MGYVTKVGKNVKSFKEGDRVFVAYGGHKNYNTKGASFLVKIPEKVSFQEAVFTRVASFPLCAIRRSRLEIGESVVVVGLGMLGLFAVQIAHLGGCRPLIAIGNREIRREKAIQFGADYVFPPDECDLTQKIYDITNAKNHVKGANVVIETSGSESGLLKCLEYTSRYGRVLLNGCNRLMTQPVDFYRYVHLRGVQIIGAHGMTRPSTDSSPGNWTPMRDYITILGLLEEGRLNAKEIISEYVSPNNISEVYDRLLNDRNFPLGVLIDWEHFNA